MDTYYTHAKWKVKPGNEAEFIEAWKAVGEIFLSLPNPPGTGTLIRSEANPTLFYSFGPWNSPDDIAAMRANPLAQAAIKRAIDLCDEATPGSYRVVARAGK